jgi:hypothetical protein
VSAAISDELLELYALGFVESEGDVVPSGPVDADISAPGVPGIALQEIGYRGEPFLVRTRAVFANAGAAAVAQILYTNYKGRLVQYVDVLGTTWNHILVRDVGDITKRTIRSGVGLASGMTVMVDATWVLQSAATEY